MSSIEKVVSCGSCVGCGACAVATEGKIMLQITPRQTYEANLDCVSPAALAVGSSVCPFADETPDETEVAAAVLPSGLPSDPRLGKYLHAYAGRITDPDQIAHSSSGGLTTWLLTQLMERGLVDGVIHVGPGEDTLFSYVVSSSVEEVRARRKSQYFPVTFQNVLREIRGDGRRYAFVGIPCAVTAVRHVTAADTVLRDQLAFVVGIVCGHLKSMAYAESFAWQLGVAPPELAAVDFRVKDPERTSREYGFQATASDGRTAEAKTLSLVGGSWGHAVFQLGACDFCDDIFAETADVVLGDAWLAKYEIDWRGTNMVVTRNQTIDHILLEGRNSGAVTLDDLSVDSIASTQAGNFRHRRDGLAVRLHDDDEAGKWHPRKRVAADPTVVDANRRELIRQRRQISKVSHELFARARAASDLGIYLDGMRPLLQTYQAATKLSFVVRLRNKLKRETWRLVGKVRQRVVPDRSARKRDQVYVVSTGVSGNLGDAVIRRRVLAWVEGIGERHVYVGGTTSGWLEQLQLTPDDIVYTAAARRKWLKGLLFGGRTKALVYDPGEVPLGTAHLKPELVFLVIALWSRLRGTYVVRPPRAVAHYHWATGMMHRWSCRLSNVVMWRDEDSKDRMRVGRLVPDTAFNEPAGPCSESPRDRLLLSLRGARAFPSDAWFEAVTTVASREGLRLTVASQVDEDEARSAELAERLDCELIPWGDDGDLARERSRRLTYAESKAVVSDRLHVLLLAAQAGAVPVEVVENPKRKVETHFAAIGLHDVSLDATGMSAVDIDAWITGRLAGGNEIASAMNCARTALDGEVALIRAELSHS